MPLTPAARERWGEADASDSEDDQPPLKPRRHVATPCPSSPPGRPLRFGATPPRQALFKPTGRSTLVALRPPPQHGGEELAPEPPATPGAAEPDPVPDVSVLRLLEGALRDDPGGSDDDETALIARRIEDLAPETRARLLRCGPGSPAPAATDGAATAGGEAPAPPQPPPAEALLPMQPGARVRVQGLTGRPELNGRVGVVLTCNGGQRPGHPMRRRYGVQLDAPAGAAAGVGGESPPLRVLLKPSNVESAQGLASVAGTPSSEPPAPAPSPGREVRFAEDAKLGIVFKPGTCAVDMVRGQAEKLGVPAGARLSAVTSADGRLVGDREAVAAAVAVGGGALLRLLASLGRPCVLTFEYPPAVIVVAPPWPAGKSSSCSLPLARAMALSVPALRRVRPP